MRRTAGEMAKTAKKTITSIVMSHHFMMLALAGNLVVALASWLFWKIEHGINQAVDEPMDAIWWAFTTVTTVGFGDIVPETFWGRIVGIVLMLVGTVLFATYIAFVANAFINTKNHLNDK